MGKGFDDSLRAAFMAGARSMVDDEEESSWNKEDQDFAEDNYREWRREFAGLGDADADSAGTEAAMADESGQDAEGSETVSGSETEVREVDPKITEQIALDDCDGPYGDHKPYPRKPLDPATIQLVCSVCGAKFDPISDRWYGPTEFEEVKESRRRGRAVFGSDEVARQMNREGL